MTEVKQQKEKSRNPINFLAYEGTKEKLETLLNNSVSSRGKKMTVTEYLNFLIDYAHKKKIYFKVIVTPELKYKAEEKPD